MVSWGTSLDSRAAKEKTAHHKSRYHTFRSRYLMISMFFLVSFGFLYVFPTLKHQRHCSALVLGPDPSASRNVQIWQRKRPDWSKVPQDVGSQAMEDPQSSPLLNGLDHFSGRNWKPPVWIIFILMTWRKMYLCLSDFPYRTHQNCYVKVPSHNQYSTPGTSRYLEAPPKVTARW